MAKSTFFKDFKAFITKGNIIDMAVGVVIGGSFGKIVTGLVNYIINPFVGLFVKGSSLDSWKTVVSEATVAADGTEVPEVAFLWGTWIQTIIDFLIIAVSVFAMIKIINKLTSLRKKEEEAAAAVEPAPAPEPEPTKEEILLTEIRDLLKEQK